MFKIGDFSKICQVSIKALRHWDEIGLLKPAYLDRETRYRYYTIDQLATVSRIQAYRGMGLPLAEISRLLADNLSPDEIRALLHSKQAQIRQQIAQGEAMIALIELRIRQIEEDGHFPQEDVILKALPSQRVATLRECTPNLQSLVRLLVDAQAALTGCREQVSGSLFGIFHDEGYDNEQIDIEVGFPVRADFSGCIPLPDGREFTLSHMPEIPLAASLVHHGAWHTLPQGYAHLGRWIDRSGCQIIGPGREVFHRIGQPPDHQGAVTELLFPVAR